MTNQMFSVGEVVIYWRPGISPHHGHECTVVSRLSVGTIDDRHRSGAIKHGVSYYLIEVPGRSGTYAAEPHELRKRPPPREDLKIVSWDECPWQPEKIHV